jgi:glutathione synthase/RimK-type ligase-like ATP-grasp enzyme
VYKLLGPSIFWDEGIPISAYTSLVTSESLKQAHRLTKTAHLFQKYVEKQFELRITVIGKQIFAAEIHSQHSEKARIDFRQQYADLHYQVHELPETIKHNILALMRFFRLRFGAIDMIMTPEGDYQFLEINVNGQFAWIEAATDLPLFRTLALLLATG